jgi:hypothetical protein
MWAGKPKVPPAPFVPPYRRAGGIVELVDSPHSFSPAMPAVRWLAPRAVFIALWILLTLVATASNALGQRARLAYIDPESISDALTDANALDRIQDPAVVDAYFQAATRAARMLEQYPSITGDSDIEGLYRDALEGFITAAQRYGRINAQRNQIIVANGTRSVPIVYFGFAWRPTDFSQLLPARFDRSNEIANHYVSAGIGVPLTAQQLTNQPMPFMRDRHAFGATAILRPSRPGFVLELYNPLVFDRVTWAGMSVPIARDLSAPLAREINESPRQYLRGFTSPNDVSVRPRLIMYEPYQPGKIPVLLVHGLYSDPTTWADMMNELRVQHDLYSRYQFWLFRYPTGGNILGSAAALRQQLHWIRQQYDPMHADPTMDNMVLVGHSLGGLISQMQITTSNDQFWGRIAQQPFSALRAPPETLHRFAEGLFFHPVPTVKRVVFIGTPHQGSEMTRRLAGRVGNALVSFGSSEDDEYREIVDNNPGVFRDDFDTKPPTSISLLEPDSPFLLGLANMPINPAVRIHSIIGTGGVYPLGVEGDGVVSVASAEHCGDSTLYVPTVHERLHRNPESIAEVMRILRLHATGR